MKTPFIFWQEIYQNDQCDSYLECLRLLKGKTDLAIVTFRQINNGIELLPSIVEVANDNGIKLVAGFELAGALTLLESYPVKWDRLFNYSRWDYIIVEAAKRMAEITESPNVALVHEPACDGFYEGQPIDWLSVESCYRKLYINGIFPWLDVPIIWPNELKTSCERYIKTIAKSFSFFNMNLLSNAMWMPGYHFDPANDKQMRAKHKSIVGHSRFHDRLFVTTQTPLHFEMNVQQAQEYIEENRGNPPVIYPRFDDMENGTQVAEAL